MLDDKRRSLGMQDEPLDDFRSDDTLLGIEEGGGFIQKIDVRLEDTNLSAQCSGERNHSLT